MTDNRRRTGDRGEGLACDYLTAQGFRILERNHWSRWGEIDIVAQRAEHLCFVEVRSWRGEAFGDGPGWIPTAKRRRMTRLAESWLAQHEVDADEITLGCLTIQWLNGQPKITFLENCDA